MAPTTAAGHSELPKKVHRVFAYRMSNGLEEAPIEDRSRVQALRQALQDRAHDFLTVDKLPEPRRPSAVVALVAVME